MSEAETPDCDTNAASETDNTADPVATIHLEGPATFERSIDEDQSVTARHQDVHIEGALTVDQETLFEIASPQSSLSAEYMRKQIVGHDSIMDGYAPTNGGEWNIEFRASVEDWKALTSGAKERRPYDNGESKAEHAMRYLVKLADEDLLGDSGLLAILELSQDPDVPFADTKRAAILDMLSEGVE